VIAVQPGAPILGIGDKQFLENTRHSELKRASSSGWRER
jgi:hypothetical protein